MRQEVLDMLFGEPVGGHGGDKGRHGSIETVEVRGKDVAKNYFR
jgi:hypothetical protein